MVQKFKEIKSRPNWVREKHLNKQTIKRLQGLRNVY